MEERGKEGKIKEWTVRWVEESEGSREGASAITVDLNEESRGRKEILIDYLSLTRSAYI